MSKDVGVRGIEYVKDFLLNKGNFKSSILGGRSHMLLLDNSKVKIKVNSKNGKVWPSINGNPPGDETIRVLCDFNVTNKNLPDCYILTADNLIEVLRKNVVLENKRKGREWLRITEKNEVVTNDATDDFNGLNTKEEMVSEFKDNWGIIK